MILVVHTRSVIYVALHVPCIFTKLQKHMSPFSITFNGSGIVQLAVENKENIFKHISCNLTVAHAY